jgi:methionine-rich copper-binding protein CopC
MMLRSTTRFWPLLAAAILLPLHLKLDRSDPSAGATLDAPPAAVRLWFSQAVELPVTKVTVTNAAKETIAVRALERATDGAVVAPLPTIGAGRYSVSWRTMAKDGHVVKGDFSFTVR